MINDAQSTGRESTDPPDVGCEFLENRMGSITKPQDNRKKSAETAWSSGVWPGMAKGTAENSRKSGAHARGRKRDQARGRSRCLHQPKFPTLGDVLTHFIGGEASPGMKSGTGPSRIPHHPGSPRSQSRSRLASMKSGGDMPYNSLVPVSSRVP